jgi:tagatose 6-phosphate kinase
MILTVTLNAALDVTYRVAALVPGGSHRVEDVRSRAGGKGVNVARVLASFGHDVVVTGLTGGTAGAEIHADLRRAGLADEMVDVDGESRRTVNVVAGGDATIFNEPGPHLPGSAWAGFRARFAELAARAAVVVLSGSLPPTLPVDAYAELVRLATGAETIVDADGVPLRAALGATPGVVTPNAAELTAATGHRHPAAAIEALRAAGARTVVATFGADGLVASGPGIALRARPPSRIAGNPTGAGDACVAALAAGCAAGAPWPERLRDAVAWSAAAVAAEAAGDVDIATCRRIHPEVIVEEINA